MTHLFFVYGSYGLALGALLTLTLSTIFAWRKAKKQCSLMEKQRDRAGF